jgi:MFS family permease
MLGPGEEKKRQLNTANVKYQIYFENWLLMPYVYWLLGSGFYFYQFVFRTIFSTLGDELTQGLNIALADLSIFFAVGMLAYSLMQVPGGILLDRFGPRTILPLALLSLGIGIIIVGATKTFSIAIIGRMLMGMGAAFGFLGTSKIVTSWFPIRSMGFLIGTTVFLGSMGGAFSKYFFEALPQDWSWRQTIISMGIAGLVLAFLLRYFLPIEHRKKSPLVFDDEQARWLQGFKMVIVNKDIMLPAFFAFFAYLPISVLADSWGILAFENIFAVEKAVANKTIIYFYIAFALGALFYSALAHWLRRPRLVLMIGFSLALVFLYLLIIPTFLGKITIAGVYGFLIFTSLIAFNCGGISLSFPLGCAHAPKEISATVVGVINMLCMVSGSIFSKLVGNILHYFASDQRTAEGFIIYPPQAFQASLQPLLLTSAIALILLWFTKENKDERPQ